MKYLKFSVDYVFNRCLLIHQGRNLKSVVEGHVLLLQLYAHIDKTSASNINFLTICRLASPITCNMCRKILLHFFLILS